MNLDRFQLGYSTGSIEDDGALMLKLILDCIEPATRLGVEHLEEDLTKVTLVSVKGDLGLLLDKFEIHICIEKEPSRYEQCLFAAILSGKNEDFNRALRTEQDL